MTVLPTGNPAISLEHRSTDRRLCVPALRRVCQYHDVRSRSRSEVKVNCLRTATLCVRIEVVQPMLIRTGPMRDTQSVEI
jgi:hypothetical protein